MLNFLNSLGNSFGKRKKKACKSGSCKSACNKSLKGLTNKKFTFETLEERQLLSISPTVIDNQDSLKYLEQGTGWIAQADTEAYQQEVRYHAAGDASEKATWTFDSLEANKTYQLFTTWTPSSNRATNAPFTVADGATVASVVRLDQQMTPSDLTVEGTHWQSLGAYTLSSDTLTVSLAADANGYVEADAIRLVEVAPVETAPSLLDDGDAAFTQVGENWRNRTDANAQGGDYRYHAAGTGQNTASWTFENLDPTKRYQVFCTWSAQSNRATNAPFSILNDSTLQNTVRVNQQIAPNETTLDGVAWESLGAYEFSSGKMVVSLSDDANGYVVADAIRLVEVPAVTTAPTVVDDGDAAYMESGSNWLGNTTTGANAGDYRYHAAGTGQNTASWTFENFDPAKQYRVFATWAPQSNRATNAPFTISDSTTALNMVRLNQQLTPDETTVDGQSWESLGVYEFTSGKMVVSLSDDANGYVVADAIRVEEVPTVTTAPMVVDDGDAAYAESGSNWLGNTSTGANAGDYRRRGVYPLCMLGG